MRIRLIVFIALVIIAIVLTTKTVLVIDAGHIAVVYNQVSGGLSSRTQGTSFLIPGFQKAILYDARIQTYTMSATYNEGEVKGDDALEALTKDGQIVKLDVSLRFHVDPQNVAELHQRIGTDYVNKVIRPEIRNVLRLAVSAYPVTEVYSEKRLEIQNQSVTELAPKLKNNYLILDEVLIRNVRFGPEFEKAIEQKQIAQQQAQAMEYVLQKEKMEKDRKIIEVSGCGSP